MTRFKQFLMSVPLVLLAGTAQAALTICNDTSETQAISIGYKDGDNWTSEGWWNAEPGECVTPVGGELKSRYYYYRAEVAAGPFTGGNYFFCTSPEVYTIVGDTECADRGYDREDFAEIDTGTTAKDFTYRLSPARMAELQSGDGLGLEFCNRTENTQAVSIAYEGNNGFVSEGWWNVEPGECSKPIGDALQKRYYYYRAEVEAGDFNGQGYSFCTTTKAYTIEGDDNCESRGYDKEDFAEIDTGSEARGFTFEITDATGGIVGGSSGSASSSSSGVGLEFCNDTEHTQAVSIGYDGAEGWTSEGWWNVEPGQCSQPISDPLKKRYYYYRAEVRAGDFNGGGYSFCTSPEAYTIVGDSDCEGRGYVTEDFAELDTGTTGDGFTVRLTAATGGIVADAAPSSGSSDGFRVCNDTAFAQEVSIGYEGAQGWTSEGWWRVEPEGCANILPGPLTKQYYYYRAEIDGGPFDGENYSFCTSTEAYTIVGDSDCEARGYETEKFAEVNIGQGVTSYTLTLIPPPGQEGPSNTATAPTDSSTAIDNMSVTGAGLEICNETSAVQSVAFGYEGAEGWTSEGWWTLDPGDCTVPALDNQRHRYLYYRAEVNGGDFTGQSYFFCTSTQEFTIVGDDNCEARGYEREDFYEIDIGTDESSMFKFALVDQAGVSEPAPTPTPTDTGTTLGDRTGSGDDSAPTNPESGSTGGGFDFGNSSGSDDGSSTEDAPVVEPEPEPEPEKPSNPRRSGSRGRG